MRRFQWYRRKQGGCWLEFKTGGWAQVDGPLFMCALRTRTDKILAAENNTYTEMDGVNET